MRAMKASSEGRRPERRRAEMTGGRRGKARAEARRRMRAW